MNNHTVRIGASTLSPPHRTRTILRAWRCLFQEVLWKEGKADREQTYEKENLGLRQN